MVGVARPSLGRISYNSRNSVGPGASGRPSMYPGGGPYPSYPPPPDDPSLTDTSMATRATGAVPVDRISRPSLFGNMAQTAGDIATGAANVRSTDPFIAFAQGFSGERAAVAGRENMAYDRSVAADDRRYAREMDQKKLDLQQKGIDAYQEVAGLKQKPMVDDKGTLTAEGNRFLITEDIAYEKALIAATGASANDPLTPERQAAIHEMVRKHHEENAALLATGKLPDTSAATGGTPPPPAADTGGGILPAIGGAIQSGGNAILNGIDSGVNAITNGMPGTGPVAPPAAAAPPVAAEPTGPLVHPPVAPPVAASPPVAPAPPRDVGAPIGVATPDLGAAPPGSPPGTKKAPDGKWYAPDPNRPGKFVLVQ